MSDACTQKNSQPVRRQRSIYKVHYCLPKVRDENMARPMEFPPSPRSVQAYSLQVAGHMNTRDSKYLGVLECDNGTILKPIIKPQQKREIEFYTRLESADSPDLVELKKFVPKYYGCRKFTYNGFEQEYIVMENLAERMLEPCIMDVKIGRRTWDPLASEEKIEKERSKYALCKQQYGFCIPGFQVHRLTPPALNSGAPALAKYGKDYGKKLHGDMVIAAIRNFLNGVHNSLCRALLLQFLSELWKIQRWASRQTQLKLYSSSILLVYDVARVRECCGLTDNDQKCRTPQSTGRRKSIHSISPTSGSNFSGQITSQGPTYKPVAQVSLSPLSTHTTFTPQPPIHSPWSEALEKLNHNHSFEHNYEDKLCKIKMNYRAMLDQLSEDTPNPNPWGTVKIIDFAHAFFNEEDDHTHDDNFREGIDNFVRIFEDFLKETDDQVF